MNIQAVEELARDGTRVLVTVDCGISDGEAVRRANELGLQVVITDHHKIPDRLPKARAVINPKRMGAAGGLPDLAGVGVAFFLAGGLRKLCRDRNLLPPERLPALAPYLGLVAVGSIADVAPLTRINRILVKEGLKTPRRSGLARSDRVKRGQPA